MPLLRAPYEVSILYPSRISQKASYHAVIEPGYFRSRVIHSTPRPFRICKCDTLMDTFKTDNFSFFSPFFNMLFYDPLIYNYFFTKILLKISQRSVLGVEQTTQDRNDSGSIPIRGKKSKSSMDVLGSLHEQLGAEAYYQVTINERMTCLTLNRLQVLMVGRETSIQRFFFLKRFYEC